MRVFHAWHEQIQGQAPLLGRGHKAWEPGELLEQLANHWLKK
eukprot:CAMPEP_0174747634 /NCGR_PEP_ID=MMETSP1094-20130205/91721_1 /TAXON_ID=156173 /ORGANISM="Chrysochromulina brevifilum, Strain UTEX LB 985" /LENGTH=41 /DNA_ID= /DNA_START= /DNA_END= /DNA_ORIENTATION=